MELGAGTLTDLLPQKTRQVSRKGTLRVGDFLGAVAGLRQRVAL